MRNPSIIASLVLATSAPATHAAILDVGPGHPYGTPCAAIAASNDGDTIRIDAAGQYAGNVCAWSRNGLTILGVNGRPRIDAAGQAAQGKAIWVIVGQGTTIDNVELSGAAVPDRNGAGIRQEGRDLTVRNSWFHDNENGILANDVAGSTIVIENSVFERNGDGLGQAHNVYIGRIDTLVFRHNWSRLANVGHLLKSRARVNHIVSNRLTGETGGTASYEINIANGGLAFVIGNLIEQPPTTENGAMLDYLSESNPHPDNRLFVVNNTFVNNRGSGTFVQIGASASPALLRNNLFVGGGNVTTQATAVRDHNLAAPSVAFVDAAQYDYRLVAGSAAIDVGTDPGTGAGQPLVPTSAYVHPASGMPRTTNGIIDVGAYEFGDGPLFADGFDGVP
ncbi:right-handed parallel beta-helix repeat-containing protein [Dokdonella sp. MW10]|uniref:right-handed parallel beta-helix repeat-containing protein n=1 Tax=Dokdonella sp. MW10 TaxID=2992926 RepID=UPI003F7D9C80